MRYVVTGADGFIASHLVDALLAAGHEVVALCRRRSRRDLANLVSPRDGQTIVWGDVCHLDTMAEIHGPIEGIYHLAAPVDVAESLRLGVDDGYFYDQIVHGTENMIEVADRLKTRLFFMSSSEVYGTPTRTPIREDDAPNPQSPYAIAKLDAEARVVRYARRGGEAVIARAFNSYGPRQTDRAITGKACRWAAERPSEPMPCGRVDTSRDWTYVDDTVEGLRAVMDRGWNGEVYNLGTGIKHTVLDVIELAGVTPMQLQDGEQWRGRAEVVVLQAERAKSFGALGWVPQVSLPDGIQRTVRWWREYLEGQ